MKKIFITSLTFIILLFSTACEVEQVEDPYNYQFSDFLTTMNEIDSYQVITTSKNVSTIHKVDDNIIEEQTNTTTIIQVKDVNYKVYIKNEEKWFLDDEYQYSTIQLPFEDFSIFDLTDFDGEEDSYSINSKSLNKYIVLGKVATYIDVTYDRMTGIATFDYKIGSTTYSSVYTKYNEINLEEPHDSSAIPYNYDLIKNFYDLYSVSSEYTYSNTNITISYNNKTIMYISDETYYYVEDFDGEISYFSNGEKINTEIDFFKYLISSKTKEEYLSVFYGSIYNEGKYEVDIEGVLYYYDFNENYNTLSIYNENDVLLESFSNLNNVNEFEIPGFTPKIQLDGIFELLSTSSFKSTTTRVINDKTIETTVEADYTDTNCPIFLVNEKEYWHGGSSYNNTQAYYILNGSEYYIYDLVENEYVQNVNTELDSEEQELVYYNENDNIHISEVISILKGDFVVSDFEFVEGEYIASTIIRGITYTDIVISYDFSTYDTVITYYINNIKYTTTYTLVNNNQLELPFEIN